MELYVLDSLLRRTAVIDSFVSCVWTERYNDVGDLTLNIHSTLGNRNLLPTGTLLAMNRSKRVMIVETVEDKSNSDGSQTLVVTGSSLEIVMDDRVARDSISGTTAEPKWVITGLPAAIARQVFKTVMVDGALDPADILPFYTVGNMYPVDTLPEPSGSVTVSMDIQSLLSALKTICQTYDLGFRITRNGDNSQLFFNVYSGNDRTSSQTLFPAVVFAPVLDNLLNSSYLTSQKQYKNMAYVYCPDGSAKVYNTAIDPATSGFSRHVLYVNATDIVFPDRNKAGAGGVPVYAVTAAQQASIKVAQGLSTTTQLQSDSLAKLTKLQRLLAQDLVNINTVVTLAGTALTAAQITDVNTVVALSNSYNPTEDAALNALLTARGLQELAKHNNITAFDGEIPKNGTYQYEKDYFLGDIAEVRNQDGVVNNVRVTEQIMSQDASGEKSYPTLSSRLVITPGVWAAWDSNQAWADVDDNEHWADLP